MTTLIIGDIHMQSKLILPWVVETYIQTHRVSRIVFIGDYFDQWNQTGNDALYISELEQLVEFNQIAMTHDISIDWLIGNHDAPYLLNQYEIYSSDDSIVRLAIKDVLQKTLKPKLTTNVEGYQVSHAGIASTLPIENFDIESEEGYITLDRLNRSDDFNPSPLWIRPHELSYASKSHYYKKQIFGHTPTTTIGKTKSPIETWNVDTFSLTPELQPIGDGSVMLIDDSGKIHIEKFPQWRSKAISERRLDYFAHPTH